MKGLTNGRGFFPGDQCTCGYGHAVPRWEAQSLINSRLAWRGKSIGIVAIGPDLAKIMCAVHGVGTSPHLHPTTAPYTKPRIFMR